MLYASHLRSKRKRNAMIKISWVGWTNSIVQNPQNRNRNRNSTSFVDTNPQNRAHLVNKSRLFQALMSNGPFFLSELPTFFHPNLNEHATLFERNIKRICAVLLDRIKQLIQYFSKAVESSTRSILSTN